MNLQWYRTEIIYDYIPREHRMSMLYYYIIRYFKRFVCFSLFSSTGRDGGVAATRKYHSGHDIADCISAPVDFRIPLVARAHTHTHARTRADTYFIYKDTIIISTVLPRTGRSLGSPRFLLFIIIIIYIIYSLNIIIMHYPNIMTCTACC